MADDPRLRALRSRQPRMEAPLPSRSAFVSAPPTPFIPIDALRQNIQFYTNELQRLRQQERIYDLGNITTAVRGFRDRTIQNPIIRRTTNYVGVNHNTVATYYSLPRNGNWIPYTRNALLQTDYLGDREGVQTQIILSQFSINDGIDFHIGGETLKSTFRDSSAGALDYIIRKKADKEDEYEQELVLRTLIIRRLIPNDNLVLGQGTGRSEKSANDTWLMIDKKARTNCFYNCLAVFRYTTRKERERAEDYRIRIANFVDDETFRNTKIGELGRNLKRIFTPDITNFTDLNIIKAYTNYTRNNTNQKTIWVKLYNNIFDMFECIYDDTTQRNIEYVNNSNLDADSKEQGIKNILRELKLYEIQYINHHFIPLVRWRDIPVSRAIETEGQQIALSENGGETTLIKKWTKEKPYNDKIASYDLEATPNGVPCFTTFCSSFCFYVADVDATYRARGEMTHYFTYTNIIEGLLLADTHSTNHTFFRFLCAKNIFRKYEGGIDWDGMATVAYDDDAIEAYGNDYQFDYEDEVKILAVRNPPKKKQ